MPRFTTSAGEASQRLDHVLASRPDVVSRSAAQRLIGEGHVLVNQRPPTKHTVLRPGDVVAYEIPPPRDSSVAPEPINIEIVYQDKDVAVVSKPAGLVVHPAHGHDSGTLVNALLHHLPDLSGIGGETRPGIVHRLDKDTSGLMLVAKNDGAHVALARDLKARKINRTYTALVAGDVPMDEGVIDAAIGRSSRDRKKMAVAPDGRSARTHFRVLERLRSYTLVELSLETGRTHQIRVHLAHIGHPVAGDGQYGPPKRTGELGLDRQFLHATKLGFSQPSTSKRVELADELPQDLAAALERARRQ